MSTGLSMDQDFTNDKQRAAEGGAKYNGSDELRLRQRQRGIDRRHQRRHRPAFAADDTEYNSLNTDRELYAIRAIASPGKVEQKKSCSTSPAG
jgi:hypothetical protein